MLIRCTPYQASPGKERVILAALLVLALSVLPAPVLGDASDPHLRFDDTTSAIILFPAGALFPPALADPHRTGFGVQIMNFSRTAIADSGGRRFNLQAGGRFGILRIHPQAEPDLGWQFSVEAGFDAQFDMDYSLDNIGWDGNYVLQLEHAPSSSLAFKVAALHISSHVGDEYAERTGRLRIGYTRHEISAAASWRPAELWRLYAEVARGYNLRNDYLQEPGRLQAGLEFFSPASLWSGRMGWYAAMDLQSWEERSWRLDSAIQTGLLFRTRDRDWRFGVEHVNGRPTIGEFFRDTESWTSFGLWIDI